jgi:hypothetical protein
MGHPPKGGCVPDPVQVGKENYLWMLFLGNVFRQSADFVGWPAAFGLRVPGHAHPVDPDAHG